MEFTFLSKNVDGISFICKNGHKNTQSLSNFYKEVNCGVCSNNERSSEPEKEICEYLTDIGIEYETSNRKLISPYEVDIYVPSMNIAIEYNGKWFHDEYYKDKNYHLMKTEMCESVGVQLIHIFDDEWGFSKEKVKHRLKSLMGLNERIYARKCIISPIEYKDAKVFCEKYHTQGYGQSSIKLGLYYSNKLISVMTFSKLSISKGNKNKKGSWELNRYCSKGNVIGGASKLLTYFKNNYEWNYILSYADRRWSNGNLYYKLGFDFIGYTPINYWYWNRNKRDITRHHRFEFRKDRIKHLGEGTEIEIMKSIGWSRIWDCGNLKFEIKKGSK